MWYICSFTPIESMTSLGMNMPRCPKSTNRSIRWKIGVATISFLLSRNWLDLVDHVRGKNTRRMMVPTTRMVSTI